MDTKNKTYKTIFGQFFQIHLSIQTLYYQRNFNTHKIPKKPKTHRFLNGRNKSKDWIQNRFLP